MRQPLLRFGWVGEWKKKRKEKKRKEKPHPNPCPLPVIQYYIWVCPPPLSKHVGVSYVQCTRTTLEMPEQVRHERRKEHDLNQWRFVVFGAGKT
jgi:hypothetical protein